MKILIIKTSSMGDVIHTLPALTDASIAIPGIRFDWLVEEAFAEIPQWHPAVDRTIPVAIRRWRKSILKTMGSPEWRGFRNELKRTHYDLAIDAQGLLKSAFLTRYVKCPIYGYDRQSVREPLASVAYNVRLPVSKHLHAVERIRHLFAGALNYNLPTSTGDFGLGRDRFARETPTEPTVVFLHGTTRADKHWPEPYWLSLCKRLGSRGVQVLLPWHGADEKARAVRIAANNPNARVLPKLQLSGIANVLAESSGFVAVDTGLGHLASALGVPGVSLYGPTSPALVGTYGDHQKHLEARLFDSNRQDNSIVPAIMQSLTPGRVESALQDLGIIS
ncbi:MAG: lipopolysaccharide heptosyltransferase I [Pseudomonadales bacterium]|nr:lipopolysaccharide heptosyltransferase I [Pseudomonadales bacterium]